MKSRIIFTLPILVLSMFVYSISYGKDIIINRNLDLSEFTTVFVEVEPNEKLEVYDTKNYLDSLKNMYEEILLDFGFNVISRDKITSIIEEQKLQYTGLTRSESLYKAGKIIGSDGIIFVRVTFFNDNRSFDEEVKLVSVNAGEIVFIGRLSSDDDKGRRKSNEQMKKSREEIVKTFYQEIQKAKKKKIEERKIEERKNEEKKAEESQTNK